MSPVTQGFNEIFVAVHELRSHLNSEDDVRYLPTSIETQIPISINLDLGKQICHKLAQIYCQGIRELGVVNICQSDGLHNIELRCNVGHQPCLPVIDTTS